MGKKSKKTRERQRKRNLFKTGNCRKNNSIIIKRIKPLSTQECEIVEILGIPTLIKTTTKF